MILVTSVKHTGTNYLLSVLGSEERIRTDRQGKRKSPDADAIWAHINEPIAKTLSTELKTVIPLRHPMNVAISWKKRGESGWLDHWMMMDEFTDAFFFPLEAKPFDELQEFTGLDLNRHDKRIRSIGEYPERNDLVAAGYFLGKEWGDVFKALQSTIGSKYYANAIRGVRP
jgi:hypothetical protein